MLDPSWLNDPGWPFLRLSDEQQLEEQSKRTFDNKTHTWVPDPEDGFIVGTIDSEEGEKVNITLPSGEKKAVPKAECQEINPAKFEKTEDMSNLTFLNEASVLHNLKQRYSSMIIYTYSGLFLVFINPYKMLPIYTDSVANMFVNRRRSEMPPHLFAVSDLAYRNMISNQENQSMLITGESGAGKTENTKKVISYFARIGATTKSDGKKQQSSLEEQIVEANPAIEAFGNGATNRNYNSSRYGKFIRIHFSSNGKLMGGDIDHYLLEKSRVIKQGPGERSFHMFYQMMTNASLRKDLKLDDDIKKYSFVSLAEITVPGMDDKAEFDCTDNAFNVMGFSKEEKLGLYKTCAAIMHMGEMKFKQKPREEQAEADDITEAQLACELFGINVEKFIDALLKPQVKVGTEWVSRGQTLQQVEWSVGSISMAIYARMFDWVIKRCNKTLSTSKDGSAHYIGVLDIAGFEIFDRNSFEQLWINFVNEKLQQFFNHHMFVLEQEEYKREGIQWTFIDFGLDLQSCIELIEKPLGIISMLDEECIVPKASDQSYVEKLNNQHLGKHPNFLKPKPTKGKPLVADFAIVHYAGTVNYSAEAWLDKNKDPLNDTAVSVLKTASKDSSIYKFWEEYKTAVDKEEDEKRGKAVETKKKGKSGQFMTVSNMYRESLNNLLSMLNSTQPHFIRCIIPNEKKTSGLVEAPLVLNQLTCNGVLEGIRICRKGFPNRMVFPEFKQRYAILAADAAQIGELKKSADQMMAKLVKEGKLTDDEYRIGNTKVFFRAGVLAKMEEFRDAALTIIVQKFQCECRAYLAKWQRYRLEKMDEFVETIQENVRKWLVLRGWSWYRLYSRIKPMLKGLQKNAEFKEVEKRMRAAEEREKELEQRTSQLQTQLNQQKEEYENLRGNYNNQLAALERRNAEIKKLDADLEKTTIKLEDLEKESAQKLKELEKQNKEAAERSAIERKQMESEIQRQQKELHDSQVQLAMQQEQNNILIQQKKASEQSQYEVIDQLELMKTKNERVEDQKKKLVEELDSMEERLQAEKRYKEEANREKRKIENELKQVHDKADMAIKQAKQADEECRRLEQEIAQWRNRSHDDANLITRLQSNIRQLMTRIEELESELDVEIRQKQRAEKLRMETQTEVETLQQQLAESNGQLDMHIHVNKDRQHQLEILQNEIIKRNAFHENHLAELCSKQWLTVNNLRNLSQHAQFLENEVNRVLDFRKSSQPNGKPLQRSMTANDDFYKHNNTEFRP
ncbi:unnamed protein product [Bursaphelenchus okinawaensis]|uniref:Myosin motor domain-containing protein n=1 Tax=Bursaphelenchus okinawaensis TaxID=465554 RepID=A0A811KJ50_9BILA|nr:unnamed protein product [Bursaphelenchus okinawaensis]CAG9105657.1 unnamed protein product [Bursaphelenchus okinawaensis]